MRVSARFLRAISVVGLILLAVALTPSAQAPGSRLLMLNAGADSGNLSMLRFWDSRMTSLQRSGELRLRRIDTDTMVAGREHERLDQMYGGVRVWGGELVRQLDNGQAVSVFGRLYEGIDLDTEPTLTPADAAVLVTGLTGVTLPAEHQPQLVILPRDEGGYALTYQARVVTGADIRVYFIDAKTGTVDFSYSDLQTAVGTGTGVLGDQKKISTTERSGVFRAWDQMRPATIYTFDMKGDLTRTNRFLNGELLLGESDMSSDADNVWDDAATVDGHVYAGLTYDYLYKRFGRQGLDGQNLRMSTLVHPVRREDAASQPSTVLNTYYLNAFYSGNGIMVYGEGLPANMTSGGMRWNYFSGALDVVSHELTHGVTDYSSGLIYRNESGALNEAFSDILGTSVEYFYQSAGSGYQKADYLIGEDLTTPIGGFRSLANPQAYGDPDHYSRRYLGTADNGGVHSNSGIANHAFYLAIEGGTNRTSGLTVTGIGSANREKIEKTFFRAFTTMLPASATFSMARAATIQAAKDLYGAGSDVERAVTDAWTACGVQ
jgi:Zn-dependent metalloprotease